MLRYKNLISTTNLFSKLSVKTTLTNTETTYSETYGFQLVPRLFFQ